jgi:ATP-dependent phosphoenolpyruvate carboxykinase
MKLFVATAQGIGDDEHAFYNVGVYSTIENAKAALANLAEELEMELETAIEEHTLDLQ